VLHASLDAHRHALALVRKQIQEVAALGLRDRAAWLASSRGASLVWDATVEVWLASKVGCMRTVIGWAGRPCQWSGMGLQFWGHGLEDFVPWFAVIMVD
jgi:hypothetical protein